MSLHIVVYEDFLLLHWLRINEYAELNKKYLKDPNNAHFQLFILPPWF